MAPPTFIELKEFISLSSSTILPFPFLCWEKAVKVLASRKAKRSVRFSSVLVVFMIFKIEFLYVLVVGRGVGLICYRWGVFLFLLLLMVSANSVRTLSRFESKHTHSSFIVSELGSLHLCPCGLDRISNCSSANSSHAVSRCSRHSTLGSAHICGELDPGTCKHKRKTAMLSKASEGRSANYNTSSSRAT